MWQSQTLLQSSTTVAKHLGVDVSTVRRIVHRFHTTGGVEKIAYPASCTFSDYQRGSVCLNHPELVHKQPAHLVSPGVAHYSHGAQQTRHLSERNSSNITSRTGYIHDRECNMQVTHQCLVTYAKFREMMRYSLYLLKKWHSTQPTPSSLWMKQEQTGQIPFGRKDTVLVDILFNIKTVSLSGAYFCGRCHFFTGSSCC